jgi:hypothetical protein
MDHYEWIVLGNDYHNDRKKTLGKIRSFAMRATAASRKKSGTWGRHNQRQYPVPSPSSTECAASDFSETVTDSSSHEDSEAYGQEKKLATKRISRSTDDDFDLSLRLGLPMPLSGLDQLAAEIGVNVLDLSALTNVHIGLVATTFLTKTPNCLVDLVSKQKPSYLPYAATRYGSTCCLDDAVRCVAAKAHRVLVGSGKGGRAMELKSYCKALRSLQSAINLKDGWKNPDVLCAVQVLSLYEVSSSFSLRLDLVLNPSSRYLSSPIRVRGQIT